MSQVLKLEVELEKLKQEAAPIEIKRGETRKRLYKETFDELKVEAQSYLEEQGLTVKEVPQGTLKGEFGAISVAVKFPVSEDDGHLIEVSRDKKQMRILVNLQSEVLPSSPATMAGTPESILQQKVKHYRDSYLPALQALGTKDLTGDFGLSYVLKEAGVHQVGNRRETHYRASSLREALNAFFG